MEQSVVNWFFPKIMGIGLSLELGKITKDDYHKEIAKVFEQAKEMEKEQMKEIAWHFRDIDMSKKNKGLIIDLEFEQYYNETFKSE